MACSFGFCFPVKTTAFLGRSSSLMTLPIKPLIWVEVLQQLQGKNPDFLNTHLPLLGRGNRQSLKDHPTSFPSCISVGVGCGCFWEVFGRMYLISPGSTNGAKQRCQDNQNSQYSTSRLLEKGYTWVMNKVKVWMWVWDVRCEREAERGNEIKVCKSSPTSLLSSASNWHDPQTKCVPLCCCL